MARLFSVNFRFQNRDHIALVTVREKDPNFYCQIRYLDHKLNSLLAGKPFVFSLHEGMKQPTSVTNDLVQSLLSCTADAVARRLAQRA